MRTFVILCLFYRLISIYSHVVEDEVPTILEVKKMWLDPPAIWVKWRPIYELNNGDAVVGYKIYVWETGNRVEFNSDGQKVVIPIPSLKVFKEKDDLEEEHLNESKPTISMVMKSDYGSFILKPLKHNRSYTIGIKAFSRTHEGNMSDTTTVYIDDNVHNKNNTISIE